MDVRQGWSGEIDGKWRKVNVTLDETDLMRVLVTAELDHIPPFSISTGTVFKILSAEADMMIYYKLATAFGYPAADATTAINAARATRDALLAALRAAHPPRQVTA